MFLEALKLGILTWESMSPNPLLVPDPSGGRDIAIFLNAEVPSPARPTTPPLVHMQYNIQRAHMTKTRNSN